MAAFRALLLVTFAMLSEGIAMARMAGRAEAGWTKLRPVAVMTGLTTMVLALALFGLRCYYWAHLYDGQPIDDARDASPSPKVARNLESIHHAMVRVDFSLHCLWLFISLVVLALATRTRALSRSAPHTKSVSGLSKSTVRDGSTDEYLDRPQSTFLSARLCLLRSHCTTLFTWAFLRSATRLGWTRTQPSSPRSFLASGRMPPFCWCCLCLAGKRPEAYGRQNSPLQPRTLRRGELCIRRHGDSKSRSIMEQTAYSSIRCRAQVVPPSLRLSSMPTTDSRVRRIHTRARAKCSAGGLSRGITVKTPCMRGIYPQK